MPASCGGLDSLEWEFGILEGSLRSVWVFGGDHGGGERCMFGHGERDFWGFI